MAERVGFEPTIRFPVCSLSRRVLSTTQSPLRGGCKVNRSRALELGAIHSADGARWKERESRPAHSEDGGLKAGATRRLPISNAFLLTTFGEEGLEDGGGFGGEDAGGDFHLVVEAGVGEDFETGTNCAALGVVGAVDEAWNAGLDYCASAHAARLDGDVERGTGKTIVAEEARGFAKDDDFGVGGGIVAANGAVAGAGDDFAIVREDGADGHFAGGGRRTRFFESGLHELDVGFHLRRENTMREERCKEPGKQVKQGGKEPKSKTVA